MTAHRISPANKDGISDLYAHFKDLYGGCREDMGVTFNADGSLKTSPVRGCQNPLGNLIMKAAASFMPSGKTSWETTDSKIMLKDTKGNQREYDLRVTDATMQWLFDEKDKDATVQHTIEFKRE
ncbi:hypothetical protein HNV11_16830 [Spirosoma taeanense]|uniref:Lipocalin-like domain-containing protein n=1 Tax=Spirosoma taeanense TaxID=2735870 RepID=A0A6M5YCB8_9BACT|nr:hypothetical protein [Spirosoma taeanense]QJW90923.1 hypothetical protein HNV11_16830 [Spirosoma taeanense]